MNGPHDRSAHVAFEVSAARVERQWQEVRARLPGRRRRRTWPWLVAASGLSAAVTAAILLLVRPWAGEPAPAVSSTPPPLTRLTSGEDAVRVALREGDRIELAPRSELELDETDTRSTRWRIDRGGAVFDVRHGRSRPFVVRAGDVEVVVLGTRFSVTRETDGAVVVSVERGRVEVRRGSMEPRRLSAGESLRLGNEPPAPTPPLEAAPSPRPSASARRRATESEPAPSVEPASLWTRATEARRAGRAEEAAAAYEAYLAETPQGTQAALAAFELGRLRMDRLGDASGAVRALRQALAIAPSAPFAEDARARLVQAAERAGQREVCAAARDDYLQRYADGVHRRVVERACP
jgi:transmembrane sensor